MEHKVLGRRLLCSTVARTILTITYLSGTGRTHRTILSLSSVDQNSHSDSTGEESSETLFAVEDIRFKQHIIPFRTSKAKLLTENVFSSFGNLAKTLKYYISKIVGRGAKYQDNIVGYAYCTTHVPTVYCYLMEHGKLGVTELRVEAVVNKSLPKQATVDLLNSLPRRVKIKEIHDCTKLDSYPRIRPLRSCMVAGQRTGNHIRKTVRFREERTNETRVDILKYDSCSSEDEGGFDSQFETVRPKGRRVYHNSVRRMTGNGSGSLMVRPNDQAPVSPSVSGAHDQFHLSSQDALCTTRKKKIVTTKIHPPVSSYHLDTPLLASPVLSSGSDSFGLCRYTAAYYDHQAQTTDEHSNSCLRGSAIISREHYDILETPVSKGADLGSSVTLSGSDSIIGLSNWGICMSRGIPACPRNPAATALPEDHKMCERIPREIQGESCEPQRLVFEVRPTIRSKMWLQQAVCKLLWHRALVGKSREIRDDDNAYIFLSITSGNLSLDSHKDHRHIRTALSHPSGLQPGESTIQDIAPGISRLRDDHDGASCVNVNLLVGRCPERLTELFLHRLSEYPFKSDNTVSIRYKSLTISGEIVPICIPSRWKAYRPTKASAQTSLPAGFFITVDSKTSFSLGLRGLSGYVPVSDYSLGESRKHDLDAPSTCNPSSDLVLRNSNPIATKIVTVCSLDNSEEIRRCLEAFCVNDQGSGRTKLCRAQSWSSFKGILHLIILDGCLSIFAVSKIKRNENRPPIRDGALSKSLVAQHLLSQKTSLQRVSLSRLQRCIVGGSNVFGNQIIYHNSSPAPDNFDTRGPIKLCCNQVQVIGYRRTTAEALYPNMVIAVRRSSLTPAPLSAADGSQYTQASHRRNAGGTLERVSDLVLQECSNNSVHSALHKIENHPTRLLYRGTSIPKPGIRSQISCKTRHRETNTGLPISKASVIQRKSDPMFLTSLILRQLPETRTSSHSIETHTGNLCPCIGSSECQTNPPVSRSGTVCVKPKRPLCSVCRVLAIRLSLESANLCRVGRSRCGYLNENNTCAASDRDLLLQLVWRPCIQSYLVRRRPFQRLPQWPLCVDILRFSAMLQLIIKKLPYHAQRELLFYSAATRDSSTRGHWQRVICAGVNPALFEWLAAGVLPFNPRDRDPLSAPEKSVPLHTQPFTTYPYPSSMLPQQVEVSQPSASDRNFTASSVETAVVCLQNLIPPPPPASSRQESRQCDAMGIHLPEDVTAIDAGRESSVQPVLTSRGIWSGVLNKSRESSFGAFARTLIDTAEDVPAEPRPQSLRDSPRIDRISSHVPWVLCPAHTPGYHDSEGGNTFRDYLAIARNLKIGMLFRLAKISAGRIRSRLRNTTRAQAHVEPLLTAVTTEEPLQRPERAEHSRISDPNLQFDISASSEAFYISDSTSFPSSLLAHRFVSTEEQVSFEESYMRTEPTFNCLIENELGFQNFLPEAADVPTEQFVLPKANRGIHITEFDEALQLLPKKRLCPTILGGHPMCSLAPTIEEETFCPIASQIETETSSLGDTQFSFQPSNSRVVRNGAENLCTADHTTPRNVMDITGDCNSSHIFLPYLTDDDTARPLGADSCGGGKVLHHLARIAEIENIYGCRNIEEPHDEFFSPRRLLCLSSEHRRSEQSYLSNSDMFVTAPPTVEAGFAQRDSNIIAHNNVLVGIEFDSNGNIVNELDDAALEFLELVAQAADSDCETESDGNSCDSDDSIPNYSKYELEYDNEWHPADLFCVAEAGFTDPDTAMLTKENILCVGKSSSLHTNPGNLFKEDTGRGLVRFPIRIPESIRDRINYHL